MKVSKLKNFFSKINTDVSMDHRIQNKLLYYDNENLQEGRKRNKDRYDRRYQKPYRHSLSRVSILKPMLPSLAVLICIAIVLLGIRANLFSKSSNPKDGVEVTGQSEGMDYSVNDTESTSESGVDVNQKEESQTQSSDTTSIEGTVTQDTTIIKTPEDVAEIFDLQEADQEEGTIQKVPANTSVTETNEAAAADTKTENFQKAEVKATEGDFYFAWFDVITENNVKASIPSLIVRFHGTIDTIDPSDLTDIVLTRDGVPVDNSITFTGKLNQYKWSYEDITDFYFSFVTDNREPGNYGLTGKYKGTAFTVYNKIIEAAVSDVAAAPDDLQSVSWAYMPDENDKPNKITELSFNFKGVQNAFYQTDLTDLKVTRDSEEVPFSFEERVFRYYEVNTDNSGDTSFNLVLTNPFTQSGTYVITGKYQGVEFTSMEIVIP